MRMQTRTDRIRVVSTVGLVAQLRKTAELANEAGLYDAADYIAALIEQPSRVHLGTDLVSEG